MKNFFRTRYRVIILEEKLEGKPYTWMYTQYRRWWSFRYKTLTTITMKYNSFDQALKAGKDEIETHRWKEWGDESLKKVIQVY